MRWIGLIGVALLIGAMVFPLVQSAARRLARKSEATWDTVEDMEREAAEVMDDDNDSRPE